MSSLETWPQKFSDFVLVSNDGKVFNCHKTHLVKNSKFFDAMLDHKFLEATNNRMDVPDYDGVTVASFLEWIYAPELGEDIVRKLRTKIKTLEEELDTESREEQEERKKEDSDRRNRLTKFRKMLREFYRGAHYDFSL